MTKRTVQVYASVTASGDALASIMVPQAGKLRKVLWAIAATVYGAAGDYLIAELSTNSARQVTTNDAAGLVSIASLSHNTAVDAGANTFTNTEVAPDCYFKAGDRIYLHATENGTSTFSVRALLFFE